MEFRRAESARLLDPALRQAGRNELRGGLVRLGASGKLRDFVIGGLRLELKAEKSGIASFEEGFDFLGFRFHGRTRPRTAPRQAGVRRDERRPREDRIRKDERCTAQSAGARLAPLPLGRHGRRVRAGEGRAGNVGQEEPLLSEDGSLFISLHGCALGKVSQQLVVRKARVDIVHVARSALKQVAVQAVGVVVWSNPLRVLSKRGIPLHFLDWRGVPFVDVRAPSRESPSILRGQLRAYESAKGVEISREMLTAKGQNQAQLLKLYAQYRARTEPALGHVLDNAVVTMERNVAA